MIFEKLAPQPEIDEDKEDSEIIETDPTSNTN